MVNIVDIAEDSSKRSSPIDNSSEIVLLDYKPIILRSIQEYDHHRISKSFLSSRESIDETYQYEQKTFPLMHDVKDVASSNNDQDIDTIPFDYSNKVEIFKELLIQYQQCLISMKESNSDEAMLSSYQPTQLQQEQSNLIIQRIHLIQWKLRELAIEDGGFLNDSIRRQVWLIIVFGHENNDTKFNQEENYDNTTTENDDNDIRHEDYDQIQLDVLRNAWTHLTSKVDGRSEEQDLQYRKQKLSSFINRSLSNTSCHNDCSNEFVSNTSISESIRHASVNYDACCAHDKGLQNSISSVKVIEATPEVPSGNLRYYQGYHDVASIILSVMTDRNENGNITSDIQVEKRTDTYDSIDQENLREEEVASRLLRRVSRTHFVDYLQTDFTNLLATIKITVLPLIDRFDKELHDHLKYSCDIEEPNFIVSWLLTWFCHDILCKLNNQVNNINTTNETYQTHVDIVKRLYDLFLVSHPSMPIYFAIALLLHPTNRNHIMCNIEADFADVHGAVAQFPMFLRGNDTFHSKEINGIHASANKDFQHSESDIVADLVIEESVCELVSLEEVIQLAVGYANQIPPSHLVDNARLYYRNDPTNTTKWFDDVSMINLLRPIQLSSSSRQDWSLYESIDSSQKENSTRYHLQMSKTSTNVSETTKLLDRTNTDHDCHQSVDSVTPASCHLSTYIRFLDENRSSIAVIAAGFGLGCELDTVSLSDDCSSTTRRKLRRIFTKPRRKAIGLLLSLGIIIFIGWKYKKLGRFPINFFGSSIFKHNTIATVFYDCYSSDVHCMHPVCNKLDDLSHGYIEATGHTELHDIASCTNEEYTQSNATPFSRDYNSSLQTVGDLDQTVFLLLLAGRITKTPNNSDFQIESEPKNETTDLTDTNITATTDDVAHERDIFSTTHVSIKVQNVQRPMGVSEFRKDLKSLHFYCDRSEASLERPPIGCCVAGKPGQMLCLTDGSQFCRPIRLDGSIDLVDLTEDDIRSCGSCHIEHTIASVRSTARSRHYIRIEESKSLFCPLEYGYCGSTENTVLVCKRHEALEGALDAGINLVVGTETCVSATSYHSHLYRIDFSNEVSVNDKTIDISQDIGSSHHICGCCDGFDPDIDVAGKCPDIPNRNTSKNFNACCHPCRSQVPKAYQPCCCHSSDDEYNCNVDPIFIMKYRYDNCSHI